MTKVKVVIGANFGDEGKGMMTDYFCSKAKERGENCLVICHNGGAQRGHTVTTPEGMRHVFHHFGSGTFVGADTYLSEKYILNPILFCQEYNELSALGYKPKVYVDKKCFYSTPYDMMLNQIIEENRGENRHGSCGIGIWETIVREESRPSVPYWDKNSASWEIKKDIYNHAREIRENYCKERLKHMGINDIPKRWKEVFYSDNLLRRYTDDFLFMLKHVGFVNDNYILRLYQNIVFEGGQGLLLDQNRKEFGENTTPSNTGLINPNEMIKKIPNAEIEVCYVTRTYLTRHGAGDFKTECNKGDINPLMEDLTNTPNRFQGSLRYGKIDLKELEARIDKDFKCGCDWKLTLAVTHLNETNSCFSTIEEDNLSVKKFTDKFDCIYASDGENRKYIKELQ